MPQHGFMTVRYDQSMTRKITVSLPDDLVLQAQSAVAAGQAESVSAYVAEALVAKSGQKTLRQLLDEWDEELGPPGPEAQAWADEQMKKLDR